MTYTQRLTTSSAFELYVDSENDKGMATHFKSAFSHPDVTVHFVGAWYIIPLLLFSIYGNQGLGTRFLLLGLFVKKRCYLGLLKG